jgi:hypothetical protein
MLQQKTFYEQEKNKKEKRKSVLPCALTGTNRENLFCLEELFHDVVDQSKGYENQDNPDDYSDDSRIGAVLNIGVCERNCNQGSCHWQTNETKDEFD